MMILIQIYGLPVFLKLLSVPKNIFLPVVMVLASIGAFAMNNRIFDVWSILFFAVLGYALSRFDFPLAPIVLGFVLGPIIELNFRRGMMSSFGNFLNFFTRPISGTILYWTITGVIAARPTWTTRPPKCHSYLLCTVFLFGRADRCGIGSA